MQLDLLNSQGEQLEEQAHIAYIEIDKISPHPDNPRMIMRDDVIANIAEQLEKDEKFEPRHAITVREITDGYQLISGHHRVDACKKAGFQTIPAWITDVSEEEAFHELRLANRQGELSKIEEGKHIASAVDKGKWGKSLKAYCEMQGLVRETEKEKLQAYQVFNSISDKVGARAPTLMEKYRHLREIAKTPESEWEYLANLLLDNEWTQRQTQAAVKAVNGIVAVDCPEWVKETIDADSWKQNAVQELINGETNPRVVRDYENLLKVLIECHDKLISDRAVWVFNENGTPEYTTYDQRSEFIAQIKQAKPPLNQKKVNDTYGKILKKCGQLDSQYEKWLKQRESQEEKQKAQEKRDLLLAQFNEEHAPIGINASIAEVNLTPESFDAVITDPPYLLSNNGITVRSGKQASVNKNFDDSKESGITPEEWLPIVFDALKPGGNLVVTCTAHLLFDLYEQALKVGFNFRQKLAWIKTNPPPLLSADRFSYAIEDILVMTKPGATPYFDYNYTKTSEDKQSPNYFQIPQCGGKERLGWHETQKPLALARLLVNSYVPLYGNLLDPFAGTATFSVVAKETARLTTWVEVKPDFYQKAESRLDDTFFPEDAIETWIDQQEKNQQGENNEE